MKSVMSLLFCLVLTSLFCSRTERVVEVIDGDTFTTDRGRTVRLLGVNAPEMTEPGGDIAKHALSLMIISRNVRLRNDVTDTDAYDISLRYVFVDGVNVNAEMVRMGYVELRFYPPDTLLLAEMRALEKVAIRNRQGLWAFPVFQVPDTTDTAAGLVDVPREEQDAIGWDEAHKYYDETRTVEGRIVASNNTGKVCFLNFHEDWRTHFTCVIFSSDFDKFPAHPESHYLNRRVRVTGLIKEYKGKPEIVLKSPSQIEIVE